MAEAGNVDGMLQPAEASFLRQPLTVQFGAVRGEVQYAGAAPGIVAGVAQVNVRIPLNAPVSSRVPISLTIGGATVSDNGLIALR